MANHFHELLTLGIFIMLAAAAISSGDANDN
jgi:hypothetical protein